jgi:hypothetical protein
MTNRPPFLLNVSNRMVIKTIVITIIANQKIIHSGIKIDYHILGNVFIFTNILNKNCEKVSY